MTSILGNPHASSRSMLTHSGIANDPAWTYKVRVSISIWCPIYDCIHLTALQHLLLSSLHILPAFLLTNITLRDCIFPSAVTSQYRVTYRHIFQAKQKERGTWLSKTILTASSKFKQPNGAIQFELNKYRHTSQPTHGTSSVRLAEVKCPIKKRKSIWTQVSSRDIDLFLPRENMVRIGLNGLLRMQKSSPWRPNSSARWLRDDYATALSGDCLCKTKICASICSTYWSRRSR